MNSSGTNDEANGVGSERIGWVRREFGQTIARRREAAKSRDESNNKKGSRGGRRRRLWFVQDCGQGIASAH
jgi:hypothetical protein